MGRPQRSSRADGDRTANRILEAAGPLFARLGFAETTSKSIAEAAGVDMASINYHFGSRSGLYEATLTEAHRQLVSLRDLQAIANARVPAITKLEQFIEVLVGVACANRDWPAALMARELLSPSSHVHALLDSEIHPKLALVQAILSEVSGIPLGHPALLRCEISVAAPCLMLLVAANGLPTPAHTVRQMPKADLVRHLLTYAQAGLSAIAQQVMAEDASPQTTQRKRSAQG